jgi:hypothetical protein
MAWNRDKERKAGRAIGIGSSIYGIVFVIIWCALAAGSGAWFMLIFGVPMLGFMIYRLVMILKQTKKTEDPWDRPQEPPRYTTCTAEPRSSTAGYCPYCGGEVTGSFAYCPACGRKLP